MGMKNSSARNKQHMMVDSQMYPYDLPECFHIPVTLLLFVS